MKILSLFDGISIAQQALKNCWIEVEKYYASEIDKYAIQITQKNFPDTIEVGSVVGLDSGQFQDIDLLIGGSPCQDLSIAKKNREGLSGQRSGLFYEYVRILNEVRPKYFVLENVNSMPKEAKEQISEILGVQPIMINAALVSAQNRKRLFWVGRLVGDKYEQVKIEQPEDKGILLRDVLENGVGDKKSYCVPSTYYKENIKSLQQRKKTGLTVRIGQIGKGGQGDRIYSPDGKSVNLSANGGGRGAKTGLYAIPVALRNRGEGKQPEYNGTDKANSMTTVQTDSTVVENQIIRKLTPIECERLQSLPDNYTDGISNTQRYKACGNGFNCAVIEHIIKSIWNHLNTKKSA